MEWHLIFILIAGALINVSESSSITERNKFILYYGSDSSEVFSIADGTKLLNSLHFDNLKKTVIYVHGYIENQTSVSVKTIVDAYRQRDDYNIITLDWHDDASGDYLLNAVINVNRLGKALGAIILEIINAGLEVNKLHLVGHSLGGQMVGRIGGEVKSKSEGKIVLKRISALDPAFPGFYGLFLKHITHEDAEFVDIIHTDAWRYGAPEDSGTVDFWPNGGKSLQPGCPPRGLKLLTDNDLCSHWRSWRFWAESVARKGTQQFNAVRAKHWSAFKEGDVGREEGVVMGNDCPTNITGTYFLQTNSESPFARGEAGTKYSEII